MPVGILTKSRLFFFLKGILKIRENSEKKKLGYFFLSDPGIGNNEGLQNLAKDAQLLVINLILGLLDGLLLKILDIVLILVHLNDHADLLLVLILVLVVLLLVLVVLDDLFDNLFDDRVNEFV